MDDGAYVAKDLYEVAFEDEREQEAWGLICNLQVVDGLSLQDATETVSGLSPENLKGLAEELTIDEDACVYFTEGWDD